MYLAGKTVDEAKLFSRNLSTLLVNPEVSVTLADSAARQRIYGPHLVAMDGTVTLGTYGNVSVVGLTVDQARLVIRHISCNTSITLISLESPDTTAKSIIS